MALTQDQIHQFEKEGYLLISGGLEVSDLDPIVDEYRDFIDQRASSLYAAGKISELYEKEPFNRRLALICSENREIYSELDIMYFRGRASFEFLRNEHMMDMVESLIGPEITCSPIQHTRAKLPEGLTPEGSDRHVAPWHQDAGVTWAEADPYFILTVWLPLSSAVPENGCLQIIPRTHGTGLMQHHIEPGLGTVIVEHEMPDVEALTLPMEIGDVLLMHKEIPHRSTSNESETVRWSMDLRYQKTGTPTGRPFYPDFVTRSRDNPSSVLTDYEEWNRLWVEGLDKGQRMQAKPHRWEPAKS